MPDGEELLRLLRERRTEGAEVAAGDRDAALRHWFLSAEQRGNDRTRIPAWRTGNRVEALVHGCTYFPQLAEVLAAVGPGDLVMVSDWRGDPDEKLTDDGPTVSEALAAAAERGATVKGLLWRSHLDTFRFSSEENRDLSEGLADHDAEVRHQRVVEQRVQHLPVGGGARVAAADGGAVGRRQRGAHGASVSA